MKIENLKLFTTVVELGSFTAAADALDLPRANVSRRINELEADLKFQLLFRTTRRLSLTKSGEIYYNKLLIALDALENANNAAMSTLSSSVQGRIKLGLLPESGKHIQHLLFTFQDLYPDVQLDIRSIHNGNEELYQFGLDLAIHGGRLNNSNVVAKKIMDVNRILVATPDYLEKYGTPETIQELINHPFICYRWPTGEIDNQWSSEDHNLSVQPTIITDNMGFVIQSVLRHRGLCFIPSLMVEEELENKQLIPLFANEFNESEEVWLLYPQRKALTHVSQLFIDFLIQEMSKIKLLS